MAARPTEKQLIAEIPAALASLLNVHEGEVAHQAGAELGLVVSAAGRSFVVKVLGSASPGALAAHASEVVAAARRQRRKTVPLLAVPFMGNVGRQVCEDANISWFDLSGNAHIVASGIRIIVDGQPNRFRRPGRPASIFAPKSARVVRWLLAHEGRAATQRAIARATDMTEGFVSRIASRLENECYVLREPSGALRVKEPAAATRRLVRRVPLRQAPGPQGSCRCAFRGRARPLRRRHVRGSLDRARSDRSRGGLANDALRCVSHRQLLPH